MESKQREPDEKRIQHNHGFYVLVGSKEPMSEVAVIALMKAGLHIEGTPLRLLEARPDLA